MYQYHCLNPIAEVGLDLFTEDYQKTEEFNDAQAVLVRSAAMHDLELPEGLEAIARAGAGVNNIPLEKCADQGIVVFNTPGANANGVKELVFAGMLLASRDIVGGIDWVLENKDNENVKKDAEKALKAFTDVVTEELKKGEKIQLVGFGTFEVSERAAREGRNPQSGEPMKIEASKAPRFKAGKALKDMINEK